MTSTEEKIGSKRLTKGGEGRLAGSTSCGMLVQESTQRLSCCHAFERPSASTAARQNIAPTTRVRIKEAILTKIDKLKKAKRTTIQLVNGKENQSYLTSTACFQPEWDGASTEIRCERLISQS